MATSKIKVGAKAATNDKNRLLWTPPAGTSKAQILVDVEHIIEANLVHLYLQDDEIVWLYTDEKGDPCEKLSIKPRLSVIVPMYVKSETGEKYLRYVRGPKSFWTQLKRLNSQNVAGIKGLIIDLTRTDGDFAKYTMTTQGRYGKIEDPKVAQDILVNYVVGQIFEGSSTEVEKMLLDRLGADEYQRILGGGSAGKKFHIVEESF